MMKEIKSNETNRKPRIWQNSQLRKGAKAAPKVHGDAVTDPFPHSRILNKTKQKPKYMCKVPIW